MNNIPDNLKKCIEFHGHFCPGLAYGYLVAGEALKLLKIDRSEDEEVVLISENNSCAIDALQVMLGTTAGKGNLIIKDYGKNCYTVYNRKSGRAFRFAKKGDYVYTGSSKEEFDSLEMKQKNGTMTKDEIRKQKKLKACDLVTRQCSEIFDIHEADIIEPSFAELDSSVSCFNCGELTMSSRMLEHNGKLFCVPCYKKLLMEKEEER